MFSQQGRSRCRIQPGECLREWSGYSINLISFMSGSAQSPRRLASLSIFQRSRKSILQFQQLQMSQHSLSTHIYSMVRPIEKDSQTEWVSQGCSQFRSRAASYQGLRQVCYFFWKASMQAFWKVGRLSLLMVLICPSALMRMFLGLISLNFSFMCSCSLVDSRRVYKTYQSYELLNLKSLLILLLTQKSSRQGQYSQVRLTRPWLLQIPIQLNLCQRGRRLGSSSKE